MTPTWQRDGATYTLDIAGRGKATITPRRGEFLLVVARESGKTDYVFGRSVEWLQDEAMDRLRVGE